MYNVFKTVFNLILAYIPNLLPELYPRPSFACYGQLIEETQDLIGLFTWCSVAHVHRKGNFLAHNLARHARHV